MLIVNDLDLKLGQFLCFSYSEFRGCFIGEPEPQICCKDCELFVFRWIFDEFQRCCYCGWGYLKNEK